MKKRVVLALTVAIAALYASFIVMDFSRFFSLDYFAFAMASAILKRVCVILAAIIVWMTGKDRLSTADIRLMKRAFIIICCAEAALFYGKTTLGIGLFIACQVLLCYRNGKRLTIGLKAAHKAAKLRLALFGALLLTLYMAAIALAYQIIMDSGLLIVVCIYAFLISASLWVAFANHALGLMPIKNSTMIMIGMFCFYCCDILVGLDGIMMPSLPWLLVNSTIWVFYVPAITLLALSCYRYDDRMLVSGK